MRRVALGTVRCAQLHSAWGTGCGALRALHALDALLGLHADERRLRRVQRELPLRHEPQVGAADLELRLHDLERALVVGERLRRGSARARARRSRRRARSRPRRTRAGRPTAYAAIACFCSAVRISTCVLSAPPLKIGISRLAPKFQIGLSRSLSTNRSLEIELTPVVSAIAGSRAALASCTRLNAAATRRSAAITSGRRSSSSDGSPPGRRRAGRAAAA